MRRVLIAIAAAAGVLLAVMGLQVRVPEPTLPEAPVQVLGAAPSPEAPRPHRVRRPAAAAIEVRQAAAPAREEVRPTLRPQEVVEEMTRLREALDKCGEDVAVTELDDRMTEVAQHLSSIPGAGQDEVFNAIVIMNDAIAKRLEETDCARSPGPHESIDTGT